MCYKSRSKNSQYNGEISASDCDSSTQDLIVLNMLFLLEKTSQCLNDTNKFNNTKSV
jgi:hypothetical protein